MIFIKRRNTNFSEEQKKFHNEYREALKEGMTEKGKAAVESEPSYEKLPSDTYEFMTDSKNPEKITAIKSHVEPHLKEIGLNIPEGYSMNDAVYASILNRGANLMTGKLPSTKSNDENYKFIKEQLEKGIFPLFNEDDRTRVNRALDLYRMQKPEVRSKMAYNQRGFNFKG